MPPVCVPSPVSSECAWMTRPSTAAFRPGWPRSDPIAPPSAWPAWPSESAAARTPPANAPISVRSTPNPSVILALLPPRRPDLPQFAVLTQLPHQLLGRFLLGSRVHQGDRDRRGLVVLPPDRLVVGGRIVRCADRRGRRG